MSNKPLTFLLIILALGFTSCFEIIKEITLKEDGSGHFEYTLNLSQSRKKLNSIRQLDTFGNYHIPSEAELNAEIDRGKRIFMSTKGVHNVKVKRDYENYIFTINLDFDSVECLNNALQRTVKLMSGNPLQFKAAYDWTGSVCSRESDWHSSGAFADLNRQNRKIFESSSYVTIVRLPQKVKAMSNANAKISVNQKAVFLKTTLLDLVDGNATLKNDIALKND